MMKTRDIVSFAAYAVPGFAVLFTAGVQLHAGQPWREPPSFWLGVLIFMCWGLLPYALLIYPDAQSGVVLVILPGGQLMVCVVAIAVAMLVNAVLCRKATSENNRGVRKCSPLIDIPYLV